MQSPNPGFALKILFILDPSYDGVSKPEFDPVMQETLQCAETVGKAWEADPPMPAVTPPAKPKE